MDILASSGSPNYDGDKEKGVVTNMTFPRLDIDAAIGMAMRNGDDSFEENDSLSAAKTFAFSGDSAGADNLRLMAGDNDFYKFTLSSSARVNFFLDTSDGAQPTFELYTGSGSKIATLGSSSTRDLAAGTYVLKVTAFSSTMSGTYSIEIDKTSDDVYEANNSASAATRINLSGGSGHIANLRLLAGNDDYYSFNLSGPSDVNISLGYDGNSSFPGATLLDSSQKSFGQLNQGGNSRTLSGGTYYIHFASSQTLDGTYSIDISATTSGPPPFSGTFNDIAVDSSGRLHLAFYDTHSHNLEYVVRSAAGVWSDVKIVDKSATSVTYVSLALDRKGVPGIAYYDAKNADLKYARLSAGPSASRESIPKARLANFPHSPTPPPTNRPSATTAAAAAT